jgi:hypothetical protein
MLLTSLPTLAQNNAPLIVHQNGLFAAALLVRDDGTSLDLNVSRATDESGQEETFLVFNNFIQNPDGFIFTFASGTIPDGALQGDNPAHVVLDVDTGQLTNFSSTTCTVSFITLTQDCGPTPGGLIHLEWRQTRLSTFHDTVDSEVKFFMGRINTHQVAEGASASVTGSVLGFDASSGSGQVGINRGSSIAISR